MISLFATNLGLLKHIKNESKGLFSDLKETSGGILGVSGGRSDALKRFPGVH